MVGGVGGGLDPAVGEGDHEATDNVAAGVLEILYIFFKYIEIILVYKKDNWFVIIFSVTASNIFVLAREMFCQLKHIIKMR